jgi:hypothetical protein
MFGILCDMPDGTTLRAHVVDTCAPAGQRPNKTPIFITGVNDISEFLAWLLPLPPQTNPDTGWHSG